MGAFPIRVTLGLSLLHTLVAGVASPYFYMPRYFHDSPVTRRDLPITQVQKELGELLSSHVSIFGPSDPRWENATERWNAAVMPDVEIVVQAGKESDVSKIVKYCNDNSIDFLARNRGHGMPRSLRNFKGLQIDLSQLKAITIRPGGKSALFQGGTYGGQIIKTLWDKGYVTPTGSNECVGFLGPALGGGHGRYEGLYGLASDNFITLNVVLADGSTVKVSEQSHGDLFWAMQGAGHNFGIVTSVESKIYPRKIDTWHYHNYVWKQDKLEEVFRKLNKFHNNGQTPVLMGVNFGQFSIDPTISETEAVLTWTFAYAGPEKDAEKLLKPFNEIEAVSDESGDVPYPEIPNVQGTNRASGSCASLKYAGSTVLLQTYNVTAQRQIYNLFNDKVAKYPGLAPAARVYYEGYANKAAQRLDPASSAFSQRDENHIVFFATAVFDDKLTEPAEEWATEVLDLWNAGQPDRRPTTYVNYATGKESLESIYGYKSWRLDRLRRLKVKYDPDNRFRFFNPFVKDHSK